MKQVAYPRVIPVPFWLKVSGKDLSGGDTVAWTSFRFSGLLTFDDRTLRIEWSGTGLLDEVDGLEVRAATVPIPAEALVVPLERVRSVRLAGGWWRPRIEFTANDLQLLRVVPGEEGGRVRCWLTRRDRRIAASLVAAILAAARGD